MDFTQQAQQIFSQPPKPINSIQLQSEEADNEIVHEMLLTMLMEGITLLGYIDYSNQRITLGENEIKVIKKYFASFGFMIGLDISDNQTDKNYFSRIKIENDKYQLYLNPLHFFRQGINEENHIYFTDSAYLNSLTSVIDQDGVRFQIYFAYNI